MATTDDEQLREEAEAERVRNCLEKVFQRFPNDDIQYCGHALVETDGEHDVLVVTYTKSGPISHRRVVMEWADNLQADLIVEIL